MLAVIISGTISTGLLALLLGGLAGAMRARMPDIVAALAVENGRVEATPRRVTGPARRQPQHAFAA